MQIDFNRYGACVTTKAATVISLGWNVWGFDFADGRYVMFHVWRPRFFINLQPR